MFKRATAILVVLAFVCATAALAEGGKNRKRWGNGYGRTIANPQDSVVAMGIHQRDRDRDQDGSCDGDGPNGPANDEQDGNGPNGSDGDGPNGYGPGDGTCDGEGPQDGSGYGPGGE
ncbi:MAG TPA: hypothetical protein PK082_05525 [Phycisphaerae bacterium]|nr:hypothetical protein [Phycisphaerae bacterium]